MLESEVIIKFLQWIDDENKVSDLRPILEAKLLIDEYLIYLENEDD